MEDTDLGFLPIGTIINTEGKGLNGRKLKLKSNSLVSRILFEGRTAVGVEYQDTVTGDYHKVYGKSIILSAGAIGSPQVRSRRSNIIEQFKHKRRFKQS